MDMGTVKAVWMGGPRHGRPEDVVPGRSVYVDYNGERILGYEPGTRWIGGAVYVVMPQLFDTERLPGRPRQWVLRWETRRVL